jgi:hypothetical protein
LKHRLGFILARTVLGRWRGGCRSRFHPTSLLQKPGCAHICVGRPATVSNFVINIVLPHSYLPSPCQRSVLASPRVTPFKN